MNRIRHKKPFIAVQPPIFDFSKVQKFAKIDFCKVQKI